LTSAEIDTAVSERAASGAPMYEVDVDHLIALAPDLVVTQSLCDVCALPTHAVERVLADAEPHVPIVSLNGRSLEGILESFEAIGAQTNCAARAHALVADFRARLQRVADAVANRERPSVVCLEWLDPPYACGHWIPEMIQWAGGLDLPGRPGIPSAPVHWSDIERVRPSVVIAMPCGYDLGRAMADVHEMSKREQWQRTTGEARVFAAAGGAYFTRPGPKLVTGIEVLAAVLHPGAVRGEIPEGVIAEVSLASTDAHDGAARRG
jgi:iron complex transport system substrate-binding protein